MEKNNRTAVEWLVRKLSTELIGEIPLHRWDKIREAVQQAKQMEKEQSKQDYDAGLFDGTMDEVKDRLHKNAEQYYQATHGGADTGQNHPHDGE
jgi:hypothetical protein